MKIWVVLPAYNEANVIGRVLQDISEKIEKPFEILVVDDGSKDDTAKVAENSKLATLMRHSSNQGLGAALRTGMLYAIKASKSEDIILTAESDGTQDVNKLNQLITAVREGTDFAVTTPLVGGRFVGVPLYRRFLSRGGNLIYSLLFPIHGLHDYTNLVRAYKAKLLKRGLEHYGEEEFLDKNGFEAVPDILIKLRIFKPKVVEIPITIDFTAAGKPSSMNVLRTIYRSLALCWSNLFH